MISGVPDVQRLKMASRTGPPQPGKGLPGAAASHCTQGGFPSAPLPGTAGDDADRGRRRLGVSPAHQRAGILQPGQARDVARHAWASAARFAFGLPAGDWLALQAEWDGFGLERPAARATRGLTLDEDTPAPTPSAPSPVTPAVTATVTHRRAGTATCCGPTKGFGVRCVEYAAAALGFAPEVRLVDGGTQGLYLIPGQSARRLLILDAGRLRPAAGTLQTDRERRVPRFLAPRR